MHQLEQEQGGVVLVAWDAPPTTEPADDDGFGWGDAEDTSDGMARTLAQIMQAEHLASEHPGSCQTLHAEDIPDPDIALAAVAPAGSTTTSQGGTVARAGPQDPDVVVTVTRSAGLDGAVLVMIDTTFAPTGGDGSPGLRVLVNDHPVWAGVAYQPVGTAADPMDAPRHTVAVVLDELTPAADATGVEQLPQRTPGPRPPARP